MKKPDTQTLNALQTLFGMRAAKRIYTAAGGRASMMLEEARGRYGSGWDAIRAVHILTERAFQETPAKEIINSPSLVVTEEGNSAISKCSAVNAERHREKSALSTATVGFYSNATDGGRLELTRCRCRLSANQHAAGTTLPIGWV